MWVSLAPLQNLTVKLFSAELCEWLNIFSWDLDCFRGAFPRELLTRLQLCVYVGLRSSQQD